MELSPGRDGDAIGIAGANNGTLINGATFAPGFVTSGNGQAFSLDIGDYVEIADSPSLRTETFTLDAWIFPTSYTYGFIIGKGPNEYFL